MKKLITICAVVTMILAVSGLASAAFVVEQGGLPYTQQSGDLSWGDEEMSTNPASGYVDAGGSFSIGGSGTYTVTGITVWDVVNTHDGTPQGLSLLNASGTTISSGYTATPATYGNGLGYNMGNPDNYPAATLYQINFTVNETLSAGAYQFFLDGGLEDYSWYANYDNGNYFGQFLLCANYDGGSGDLIPWLENIGATDGSPLTVGTFAGNTGNAYVQVVPEPATICLLGLGALSLLRRKR